VVKRNDGTDEAVLMRWGLVPSWARDVKVGTRMINARAETVAEKPSFRTALRRRRALVFSDGFFGGEDDRGLPGRGL
jgi:putative SOS response-associated peptidase YedK